MASRVPLTVAAVAALFREQALLSVADALAIIHETQELLLREPNMVRVRADDEIFVFGDIHGQFFDLLELIDAVGLDRLADEDIRLVFLGDYVDRGAFSCEVILYLLLLKLRFPTKVVLLRGNHECETISSFYGFRNECRVKYGLSAYYHFVSCFQALPVAALLDTPHGDMLCVHGGISPDVVRLDDIDAIDRRREVPMDGPLCDLLWADPVVGQQENESPDVQWTTNKVRGCSYYFNASALFAFLQQNNLLCVIRAHEYEEAGYMYHFSTDDYDAMDKRDNRSVPPLITVFSAANYCDTNRNKAGYLIIHGDPLRIEARQVESVGHPIPGLVSVERSADIWRQFRQTLPFLPASKDFFEETMAFVSHMEAKARQPQTIGYDDRADNGNEARRKRTSEMHPQAIRRVLDEEASKWMQSDDAVEDIAVFPVVDTPLVDKGALRSNAHYRAAKLSPAQVDMMKLIFSLLDTDGSMTLNASKVSQFVFNILGERITPEVADVYLDALDFDRNGVVDFADILSWGAVMKANYKRRNQSIFSLSFIMRRVSSLVRNADPYRGFLWISVLYIVRDIIVLRRTRLLRSKSLLSLAVLALALYIKDVVRICRDLQLNRWCELFPLWELLARVRRRELSDEEE